MWLAGLFVLFDRVSQQFFAISLQHVVHVDADRVFEDQLLAHTIEPWFGVARIGAHASNVGTAFLFDMATGNLKHTFANPTSESSENFERSFATTGNTVIIGAPKATGVTGSMGEVYLFDGAIGKLERMLQDPQLSDRGDDFGRSVAVLGSDILVGAHQKEIKDQHSYSMVQLGLLCRRSTTLRPNREKGLEFPSHHSGTRS